MYKTIQTSLENNIYIITINRPEKLNALNKTVIEELSAAIGEVYNNHDIKSAIITGAGEKAFVAGADISEFLQMDENSAEGLARKVQQTLFDRIENSHKPIVAAVNGFALGGGFELALACKYRVAASDGQFSIGLPETKLGLLPAWGGTTRLPRLIGLSQALSIILGGKTMPADKAHRNPTPESSPRLTPE